MLIQDREIISRKSRNSFVTKINAITPLISLGVLTYLVTLASSNAQLWDSQGFIFVLGSLLGNSATGALTQKDDKY